MHQGFSVLLTDVCQSTMENSVGVIRDCMYARVKRGEMPGAGAAEAMARIHLCQALEVRAVSCTCAHAHLLATQRWSRCLWANQGHRCKFFFMGIVIPLVDAASYV